LFQAFRNTYLYDRFYTNMSPDLSN
jgi:hypothetical protein